MSSTVFRVGAIHRPETVQSVAGGKGCNVARACTLGEKPMVTGWVGGTAGQFIERELEKEGIATDFVYTDFESRTCTSILDSHNQTMTEIYEKGEPVPPEKVAEMLVHFREKVNGATAVSLSGSIPPGVPTIFMPNSSPSPTNLTCLCSSTAATRLYCRA
ncbi:MAG: PfkB family carbohydrate kinase [Chloroflexi bacterium]|nr:PfkB family carbohydrate kinase [Chloroflexota bacterium]